MVAGTKRVKYLEENVAAFFVKLSQEEISYLSDLFKPDAVRFQARPTAGDCCALKLHMKLDSLLTAAHVKKLMLVCRSLATGMERLRHSMPSRATTKESRCLLAL